MASSPITNRIEGRAESRDEVFHRTRMTLVDRRQFPVTLVNVSVRGLMIRTEAPVSAGEWIKVTLPIIGEVHAAVRWVLGGRIGCEFDRRIMMADYPDVLLSLRG